uniref:Integrase catalytic domain-containing protein n=1 Tax=Tanacetum cinerariifolium TaxID=118510 RepID=A0A699GNG8_TANCI|nr:hypothetical protein [Tanacetum cinerariifolium]
MLSILLDAKALCFICNECLFDANHAMCLIGHVNSMNVRAKSASKKNKNKKEWKPTGKVFNSVGYKWKPTGRTFTLVGNACPLTRLTATNKVPLRIPIPLEVVALKHVVTRVYTRLSKLFCGIWTPNAPSTRPKIALSLSISFINFLVLSNSVTTKLRRLWDLEVAFRKHTCFVRNLEGVDLLLGSRGTNLYSLSIGDITVFSPICLLSKATKTKAWLWNRLLSNLNFGAINHLARHCPVRSLTILKFEKGPFMFCMCHEKKPMRVASVNGKKYILVIVDDYSWFTWVKFLASKDEAPDFIIKFLKTIQVRLNAAVRNIRTDNGTEFVNQTLRDYYEQLLPHVTPKTDPLYDVSMEKLLRSSYMIENLIYHTFTFLVHFATQTMIVRIRENFKLKLLTAMASEQSSLEPALHEITPATPSSGLVPNPPSSSSFIPPSKHEWDVVFDEFFSTRASVASLIPVEEAHAPVESTGSPFLTTVDQDAPSPSTSQTTPQSQSQTIPFCAEEESHDLEDSTKARLTPHCSSVEKANISSWTIDFIESQRHLFKQIIYALESLKKYEMESCDTVGTPMVEKSKLDEDPQGKSINPTHYRGMVGTLMYLTSSRPNLVYDSAIALIAFLDADHAGCQDTRHSTSGSMQLLGDRLVRWSSKSAIALCCNNVQHCRSKHIDIRYRFIEEQVENGVIELYFVRMKYQLVDIFTKALCRERIEFLIDKLGMRSFTAKTLKELADEAEE